MKVKAFVFNPVSENTYVVYDDTKECVIIDAGCFFPEEKAELVKFIEDNELVVKHIINTHLHFDHVLGLNFVMDKFDKELQASQEDEILLDRLQSQLEMFGFPNDGSATPQIGKYITEKDTIEFGKQQFKIYHVPGHSPGSLVFYSQDAGCMFVGDVLFRGSVGRSDLIGGDHDQLISGIKSKLLNLPDETVVYSGHGPSTTIGYEKMHNPFLV